MQYRTTNTAQRSGYDCLNRLTSLHNTATTATSTQFAGVYECWYYDAFGNRTAQTSQTSPCPAQASVQATARYNANNQVTWTSVNAAVNGFGCDAAGNVVKGNVVNDNVNQYLYDGEGRICAVASTPVPGFTTLTGYVYDADGHRVAKGTITSMSCDPSLNGLTTAKNETEYILGQDGEPVSELAQDANGSMQWQRSYVYAAGALIGTYDPAPNPAYNASNPGGVSPVLPVLSFRLTDWQGTLRATADASGVLQGTCTSLPYGDQLTCQGNIPDNLHFTGKERDAESGNDYFGARYYASNMGRFMTPDWAVKPIDVPYASFGDPQTLNLYAYAQNGPLNRVDAEGHASDQSIVTLPVNPGESCVSFSAPVQKCDPNSGGQVSQSAEEVAYVALVQHEFAAAGNTVDQQQTDKPQTTDSVTVTAKPSVWKRIGGWFGGAAHSVSYAATAFIITHSKLAMEGNKSSFEYWSKQSNENIIKSLNPGGKEPMQIRMDGEDARIINGNMRYSILQSRGADMTGLKPEVLPPVMLEPMVEPMIEPEIIP